MPKIDKKMILAAGRFPPGDLEKRHPDPERVSLLASLLRERGFLNLSRDTGLSPGGLSRVIQGKTNPSWASARVMSRAMNVTLDELAVALDTLQRWSGTKR